jgi:phosphoglycerate kinase
MTPYLTLDQVDVSGKAVLVRSDLNVPIEGGVIGDDFRIRAALPTLDRLVESGARVTVCSHLGRPEGPDPAFSLRPVAARLQELSPHRVAFAGEGEGDIRVLENTRFDPGESKNAPESAERMASGVDIFVQDAFGSVHRAHASTVGVAERVKSVAGPLLDAELSALGRLLDDPVRPYAIVLGGAKVSDKLAVIENLLPRADVILIGGGMCFTLLQAKGIAIGRSLVEPEMIENVRRLVEGPDGEKLILPVDVVVAEAFQADSPARTVNVREIPDGMIGLDIGHDTGSMFAGVVRDSETIFWNGPMGVFEWEQFSKGTEVVARAMSESPGFTAVGGGDSVAAIRQFGLEGGVDHVSTGGGAGLELLEGKSLPGVEVLARWVGGAAT